MAAHAVAEDYARYRQLAVLIARAEIEAGELEEAVRLLKSGKPRAAFRLLGGRLLVELTPEEALEYVEEELAKLKARIEAMKKEREELRRRLASAGVPLL